MLVTSIDQARLVARVLPYIRRRQDFALNGGTAINLFIRALPRLSVDIDLVFLPINPAFGVVRKLPNSHQRRRGCAGTQIELPRC